MHWDRCSRDEGLKNVVRTDGNFEFLIVGFEGGNP